MICDACKKEFDNINGLKFCPYCGEQIEEKIVIEVKEINHEIDNQPIDNISEGFTEEKIKQDTVKMPVVTDEDVKKYNRNKFLRSLKKAVIQKKVIIPIVTILLILGTGAFGYQFLVAKVVTKRSCPQNQ